MAPFWSNNDISNRVGNISYEVHTEANSPELINLVSSFITQQEQVQFNGNWMLVARWNDVPQSGGSLANVSSIVHGHIVNYMTVACWHYYRPTHMKASLSPTDDSLMPCSHTSVVGWSGLEPPLGSMLLGICITTTASVESMLGILPVWMHRWPTGLMLSTN